MQSVDSWLDLVSGGITRRVFAPLVGFLLTAQCPLASVALADCCRIIKTDAESPAVPIRVCETPGDGTCSELLFEGTLQLGESETVCSDTPNVSYTEWDESLGSYGPPVVAICAAGDVEL